MKILVIGTLGCHIAAVDSFTVVETKLLEEKGITIIHTPQQVKDDFRKHVGESNQLLKRMEEDFTMAYEPRTCIKEKKKNHIRPYKYHK